MFIELYTAASHPLSTASFGPLREVTENELAASFRHASKVKTSVLKVTPDDTAMRLDQWKVLGISKATEVAQTYVAAMAPPADPAGDASGAGGPGHDNSGSDSDDDNSGEIVLPDFAAAFVSRAPTASVRAEATAKVSSESTITTVPASAHFKGWLVSELVAIANGEEDLQIIAEETSAIDLEDAAVAEEAAEEVD